MTYPADGVCGACFYLLRSRVGYACGYVVCHLPKWRVKQRRFCADEQCKPPNFLQEFVQRYHSAPTRRATDKLPLYSCEGLHAFGGRNVIAAS